MQNQAFGWLKKSIKGIGGSSTSLTSGAAEIGACSDPAELVDGVRNDFAAILSAILSASSASGGATKNTANVAAASGGVSTPSAFAVTSREAAADGSSSTPEAPAADGSTTNDDATTIDNDHLNNLTTRLDRIKILLYEERSASSNAVTQSGSINLNWIPATATSVFKNFTMLTNGDDKQSSDDDDDDETNSTTNYELIPKLIQNLPLLPFEARKSVSAIFNYLLVCGLDGVDARQYMSVSSAFATYVLERAELIVGELVRAHNCHQSTTPVDVTLLCGSMLRSSLRHANIYRWMLADGQCEKLVYPFLDSYVHNPNFDVSSDALETVRVMLTGATCSNIAISASVSGAGGIGGDASEEEYKRTMEGIASDFLNRKYTEVIDERINKKCLSSNANYMTRRMSLQLLSSILLNRANYNVMMMYISSSENLVTILCLLRDPSPHITLDSFQVFKIFVANPNKPPEVVKILFDNKVKLVKYLEGLHKEREGSDEQYRDEKQLVISTLEGLEI